MFLEGFNSQMKEIFWGNLLLIICSLFYLWWWTITFRPGAKTGKINMIAIILAVISGIIGLIIMIRGINGLRRDDAIINGGHVIIGGIAAYLILLLLTYIILRRQITTELFLIVGWSVLELTVVNALYGAGRYLYGTAVVLLAVIIIAAALSLVCYILYYSLKGTAAYVDGMIPLIIVAAVMSLMEIAMVF